MTRTHLFFIVILFWVALYSCITDDVSSSFSTAEINRLLNAGSSKVWSLQSKFKNDEETDHGCQGENTITFVSSTAGDSLYVLGKVAPCEAAAARDTLFKAQFVNDGYAFTLSGIKHLQVSNLVIDELSSVKLKLSYQVEEDYWTEFYSF